MDHHQQLNRRPQSNPPSSIKRKLQSSLCCFGKPASEPAAMIHPPHAPPSSSPSSGSSSSSSPSSSSVDDVVVVAKSRQRLMRCSSSCVDRPTTKPHRPELLIRDKCRGFISRMGRRGCRSRRHSTDFGYDPLSYSLNFDDRGDDDDHLDASPLRSFSARLPHSPPPVPTPPESPATAKCKEISDCR